MKRLLASAILSVTLGTMLHAQVLRPATELPDISVIGIIDAAAAHDHPFNLGVTEVELAIQGYLYPSIRTDIFAAFHKNEEGIIETELEEAYVTFLKLWTDTSGIAGKKLINFGRVNQLHPEQWPMINKPQALRQFFGEEGLSGEGVALSYLLPLPTFVQLEAGIWQPSVHGHEEEATENHSEGLAFHDKFLSTRLWTALPVSEEGELELGGSFIFGNGEHTADGEDDRIHIYGIDGKYRHILGPDSNWLVQAEALFLDRQGADALNRRGGYVYGQYVFNRYWNAGLRLDMTQSLSDEDRGTFRQLVANVTNSLTETSKVKVELGYDLDESALSAAVRFIFGLGPHSHVLQ